MVKKTSSTITRLKDQVLELENKYKRALADYHNQDRRHQESASQMILLANATLIEKLLNPLDSLELANTHLKDHGLKIIIDQFFTLLSHEGLTEIKSDGQIFDPLTMDCVEILPGPKDQVNKTLTKGYYLSGKVLRPARVTVGSGEEK